MPQGREIFPRLTVEENLSSASRPSRRGATIPPRIFEMFPVLADMLGRRGGDLSGGQQQQLAIGRALAMEPKLLVLDEPTEGIQPSIIKDIERAIRRLAAEGEMAILLVEQYYDFARSLADRYVVLSRGEVIKARQGRGHGSRRRARLPDRLSGVAAPVNKTIETAVNIQRCTRSAKSMQASGEAFAVDFGQGAVVSGDHNSPHSREYVRLSGAAMAIAAAADLVLDTALVKKYDGFGPRYTSYPTADRFHAGCHRREVRRRDPRAQPGAADRSRFRSTCTSRSATRSATTARATRSSRRTTGVSAKYIKYVGREIEIVSGLVEGEPKVEQLHWGGGTPTFLARDEMSELMGMLRGHFAFAPDAEISIEVDPRKVDPPTRSRSWAAGLQPDLGGHPGLRPGGPAGGEPDPDRSGDADA